MDTERTVESLLNEYLNPQAGTDQAEILNKLVIKLAEENISLRTVNDKLKTQINPLEESVKQLQDTTDINFYFSVAALVLAVLLCIIFGINKIGLINSQKAQKEKFSNIDKNISNLNDKIDNLNNEIATLKIASRNKKHTAQEYVDKNYSYSEPTKINPAAPKSAATFKSDFNQLMKLKSADTFDEAKKNFLNNYQIFSFSCDNSSELTRDYRIEPRFKTETSIDKGDYWAYDDNGRYLVVPSPFLNEYNNTTHIGRAFGKVFDSTFKTGGYFSNIRVEEPAVFKKELTLAERGILRLTNG